MLDVKTKNIGGRNKSREIAVPVKVAKETAALLGRAANRKQLATRLKNRLKAVAQEWDRRIETTQQRKVVLKEKHFLSALSALTSIVRVGNGLKLLFDSAVGK